MVLKTETCRFSGLKIYPGKGIKLARTDGQVLLFLNSKCKRLYNNKLKASKLAWTALYRKAHKKDQSTEAARRKKRSTKVTISRSIGSASLELIQKRRNEKSDVRAAARENALREIKERAKRLKEEKAKTKTANAAAKPKQAAPKAGGQPKGGKGGPGGKR